MADGIRGGIRAGEDENPAVGEPEASPSAKAFTAAAIARFRILDQAPNAFMALDREWRYTYINEVGARQFGKAPSDLTGRVIWEVWPEAVGSVFWNAYHRAMDQGEFVEADEYFQPLDRWFEVRAYPIDTGIAVHFTDITVRRQGEEARARLAAVAESSNDAIVIRDPEGKIVFWNAGATGVFGYTSEEMVGTDGGVLIPPELLGERSRLMENVLQGRAVANYDTVRIRKDGSRIYVSSSRSPIRDHRGKVVGTAGIARDVTERKRAEEAHARLATVAESSNDAITIRDVDGRIVFWNEGATRIYGYTSAEMIGTDGGVLMPPELLREPSQPWQDALQGRTVANLETVRLRKDGSRIALSISISPIKDGGGKIIGIVGIGRDITERKQAEAHLRLAASVIDNAAEGVVITDRDNNIISVNRAFKQITGYAADEVVGKNPRLLAGGAQTGTFYEEMWATIKAAGRWQGEVWDKRKSGERYCEWLSISAVRNEQGEVSHYCGVFGDITGRKRAELALRESEAKLRGLYKMPHVGLLLTDINCRYLEFNEAYRQITGYSDIELRGLDSWKITPKDYEAVDTYQLELAKRTGQYGPYEKEYVRKDGSRVPIQLNGALFTASDGTQYLWTIVEDITDRKHLERAVLEATDRERRTLGADLHDGLGQELTGAALRIGALAHLAKNRAAPEFEKLAQLEGQIRHAIGSCRTIAHGLSPLSYASGGLVGALQEMARAQEGRGHGPEVHFTATAAAPLRLPSDAMDHLYRIAQEAVTNAQRHAEAQRIDIRLDIQPATVRLEIADDGIGFATRTAETTGMGQQIMRFRTSIIGARLSIGSGRGGGTLVAVECPQPP